MINDPLPISKVNSPRAAVYINGELLQGMVSVSVDNNAFFQADTFYIELAISAQPKNRNLNFWASLEKAECEIYFGYPANPDSFDKSDLEQFLIGNVDEIEIDPVSDHITLSGRDLTALLIDTRQTLAHISYKQKASDIITAIANQAGLKPVVTATVSPVGTYQNIVHALLEQKASYWDVCTKLAQIEGYQIYVKGRELHFEPYSAPSAEPYVIRYTPQSEGGAFALNAMRLTFSRNLTVAKDVQVDVVSYNSKTGKAVKGHAERSKNYNKVTKGSATLDDQPVKYFYAVPNLDSQTAQQRANTILQYLIAHEMNLSADLPGDIWLTPQSVVVVEGTQTPFDQIFYASNIQRTFSFEDGFRMHLTAKNQSPNNPPSN